jgi:Chalcone isomerase-like
MRIPLTGLAALGLLALWSAQPAAAAVCRGVQFPESLEVQGAPLVLNGLGIRKATFLKINVYVAALYVPRSAQPSGAAGASDARALIASPGPMQLVLHFVRGVGVRDIRNAFEEGFAAQGGGRVPVALTSRVALLNSWMQAMRSGEAMTFVRMPGRGIEFDLDGHNVGVIPGEDFAQALFAIWLGDHPPNPELKAGLLGGPCG